MSVEATPLSIADTTSAATPSHQWLSVVFLQGNEAAVVLDLIENEGVGSGIDYLTQWDFGDETTDAALVNGYVYATVPTGATDRAVESDSGEYVLTYSAALGHASLLRRRTDPPDPDLAREAQLASMDRASRRDWFDAPRVASPQHGQAVTR